MTAKENSEGRAKSRGRPRAFDVGQALDTAQAMFHEHGYGAVGVAALTEALGINPPSFYAAFGSKAALFERVMERYAGSALPLDAILVPGRDPVEAIRELMETAARLYAADSHALGCLVIETARSGGDADMAGKAAQWKAASRERIRAFLARTHPGQAAAVAGFADTMMAGLSAQARTGWTEDQLLSAARMAATAVETALRG